MGKKRNRAIYLVGSSWYVITNDIKRQWTLYSCVELLYSTLCSALLLCASLLYLYMLPCSRVNDLMMPLMTTKVEIISLAGTRSTYTLSISRDF